MNWCGAMRGRELTCPDHPVREEAQEHVDTGNPFWKLSKTAKAVNHTFVQMTSWCKTHQIRRSTTISDSTPIPMIMYIAAQKIFKWKFPSQVPFSQEGGLYRAH